MRVRSAFYILTLSVEKFMQRRCYTYGAPMEASG